VWDYAEDSVSYIFGQKTGNKDADKILEALRIAPKGLNRSEISKIFQGNYAATQIDTAVGVLRSQGLISEKKSRTQGTGRPTTIYKVV
jgi:chromosome segregation and condensation protein ScpB